MWLKFGVMALFFLLGIYCEDSINYDPPEPFDYYDYEGSGTDNISFVGHKVGEIRLEGNLTEGETGLDDEDDLFDNQTSRIEDKDDFTTHMPSTTNKSQKTNSHDFIGKNISIGGTNTSLNLNNTSINNIKSKEVTNLTAISPSTGNTTESNQITETQDIAEENTHFPIFNLPTTSNITSISNTTAKITTTSTAAPIIPINTTTSTTNSTEDTTDDEKASIFKGFNFNYLYYLLLLIPIAGVGIGVTFFCKRRKRKDGYTEPPNPRTNKNRRFSTPSWVFSEPDFADEEVITLQEEKK